MAQLRLMLPSTTNRTPEGSILTSSTVAVAVYSPVMYSGTLEVMATTGSVWSTFTVCCLVTFAPVVLMALTVMVWSPSVRPEVSIRAS
jgi:hypothetical protein